MRHSCVDTACVPTHGLDDSLRGAAAAQTMSGLSLTPPIPLRIRLERMVRERLQVVADRRMGADGQGEEKDVGSEEVARLSLFPNILSCYSADGSVVKRQAWEIRSAGGEAH